MKKPILLNYLLNKTYQDKHVMDNCYSNCEDIIVFSKKMYGDIRKIRSINDLQYGIEIKIRKI